MSATTNHVPLPPARANELYWSTDDPVQAIAARVGMSRSAVYTAIEPLSTGVPSPNSDEMLVFTNRTNRDNRLGTCMVTGTEVDLDSLPSASAAADGVRRWSGPGVIDRVQEGAGGLDPEKVALAAGCVALGLALGVVSARWIR